MKLSTNPNWCYWLYKVDRNINSTLKQNLVTQKNETMKQNKQTSLLSKIEDAFWNFSLKSIEVQLLTTEVSQLKSSFSSECQGINKCALWKNNSKTTELYFRSTEVWRNLTEVLGQPILRKYGRSQGQNIVLNRVAE